jgi:gliding motility-associated-like protein
MVHAQYTLKENNTWVFGANVSMDFNSGSPVYSHTPVVMGGACTPSFVAVLYEASASVSDANGNLLFSTDGSFIWDRSHNLMPNAQALHPYGANQNMTQYCTQGATIVPMPGDPDKYYVFSLTGSEVRDYIISSQSFYCGAPGLDAGSLFYSIVDKTLNGGMGDVVAGSKWIPLDTGLTEKAIAVRGNRCNVWLIVHSRDSALFKAYEITYRGINPVPVVSAVGISGYVASRGVNAFWTSGQLAISPDRTRLAAGYAEGGVLELYDFDPNTGIVSNPVVLNNSRDNGDYPYGLAFSPDSKKLYAYLAMVKVNSNGIGTIFQYNLTQPTTQLIIKTRKAIATGFAHSQLKLASNGKIYWPLTMTRTGPSGAGTFYRRYLSAINFPDSVGLACGYEGMADSFVSGALSGITCNGLPNEIAMALPGGDTVSFRTDTAICFGQDSLVFEALPGYDTYRWENGSTATRRVIRSGGAYVLVARDSCHTRIDSFFVKKMIESPTDPELILCPDQVEVELVAPAGFDDYTWSDESKDSVYIARGPGIYYVTSRGLCPDRIDSFTVTRINPSFSLGEDSLVCDGSPVLLEVTVPDARYTWQDGSTDNTYRVTRSGTYSLTVDRKGCLAHDTVNVLIYDVRQDLGADTLLCSDLPLNWTLQANVDPGASVMWSDGSDAAYLQVADSGQYWVTVTAASCVGTDTVSVTKQVCDCRVYIPSAFSPNGDGRNDVFRPGIQPGCIVSHFEIRIYNRWGQLVYSGTDPLQGWDGTQQGLPVPIGTYMYRLVLTGGTSGKEQTFKGDFVLIR